MPTGTPRDRGLEQTHALGERIDGKLKGDPQGGKE